MKKKITYILLSMTAVLMAFLGGLTRPLERDDSGIWSPEHFIAHGGGAIDGYCYTNSQEALLSSLEKGFKYVELDLFVTTDSVVVCLHNLKEFNKMTSLNLKEIDSKVFKNSKLYGRYTPMTLEDAISISKQHPFYFVTDNISSPAVLNRYFTNNRRNVIVEAFSTDDYVELYNQGYTPMLSVVDNIFSLKRYIIASIKIKRIVPRIVMGPNANPRLLRFYKRMGTIISTATENSKDYVEKHVGREIDMIYTDHLLPQYN